MIEYISIKNFAIIENTEIEFENGLNIITGETGAGKSIVVEAISLALGSRADSSYVRTGKDKAIVQLVGTLNDEEIIVTREVSSSGKNLCKLNDQVVTLGQLNQVCMKLADIHGQYDNQSLLNAEHHIDLIDNYNPTLIEPIKNQFCSIYNEYKNAHKELLSLIAMEQDNAKQDDFYRYQIAEIEKANLVVGEDEELSEKIAILQNSEKIYSNIEAAYNLMSGDNGSALSALNIALRHLTDISQYSTEIRNIVDEFGDTYFRLEDIASAIRNMRESITFSPDELDKSISRMDLLENLKKKYANSIESVIQYKNEIAQKLSNIENYDLRKKELEDVCQALNNNLTGLASKLTDARKSCAAVLEERINKELKDLNFDDAYISISFNSPTELTQNGNDLVEILISTNRGEPLKPLVKIASGGEISRIMLAFKNIIGNSDNIATMIFDEIDQGISGVTASIVAKKLKEISRSHQIICITHLPQIAAVGDYNYRIFKESDSNSTYTYVERLSLNDKVDEIARLLGGSNVTDTTRKSALELIQGSNAIS